MFVNLASQWFGDCAGIAVHIFALCFDSQMLAVFPLCVCFFSVFLDFVMPVGILFPAPTVNRRDTVSRDSATELKLSAPDPKA